MAANRYAIANGNYSNPAIWNGGLGVPAADDTVRPNGFTVVIDQSITAAILTNNASSPAVAGGGFQVTATSGTINIVANIEGRYVGHVARVISAGVTVNLVGNLSQYTLLFNATTSYCISIESNCVFSHTGNASGGINTLHYGPTTGSIRFATANPTATLTGVYTGGANQALSPNPAICVESGVPTINITGSLIGGNVFLGNALFVALAGNAANIAINGTITSGIGPAISVTCSNYAINPPLISGVITNVNGVNAIDSPGLKLLNNASTIWTYQTNDSLSNEVMYTADELTGYPPTNKTEQGYVYGPNNEFTGTLVPVNVDLSPFAAAVAEELWNKQTSTLTEAGSIGARLANCATVQTTGDQLAAALI